MVRALVCVIAFSSAWGSLEQTTYEIYDNKFHGIVQTHSQKVITFEFILWHKHSGFGNNLDNRFAALFPAVDNIGTRGLEPLWNGNRRSPLFSTHMKSTIHVLGHHRNNEA